MSEKIILDANNISRVIARMAHQILECNKGIEDLVLIGISQGGITISQRLCDKIAAIEGVSLPLGVVDVTLHRDDIRSGDSQQVVRKSEINFSLEGKSVILIDDVLFTGRTIRAAMDALMGYGRPKMIQLAVFIDRGHRELPIRADYVGKNIPTTKSAKIELLLDDNTNNDKVIVTE